MSLTLVINDNNVVQNGLNTQFQYNFISGGITIPENSEICISNLTIPYSWYNINQQIYNNASFQYTWPNQSGQQTYNVNISNGFYTLTDINQYLQTVFIQNGQYLVDQNGEYVYYITMTSNSTYYGDQVVCYALPTVLPQGWTNPNNVYLSGTTPQLVILNNNFGSLIGYLVGSYPSSPQTSTQDFVSNTTPNASPVNSLVLRCNLIDNNVVMPSDILDSVPINTTFGSNITYQPTFAKWIKLKAGKYTNLTLTIYDQDLNNIQARDANVTITLLLKLGNNNMNTNK